MDSEIGEGMETGPWSMIKGYSLGLADERLAPGEHIVMWDGAVSGEEGLRSLNIAVKRYWKQGITPIVSIFVPGTRSRQRYGELSKEER